MQAIEKFVNIGKKSKILKFITLKKITLSEAITVQYLDTQIEKLSETIRKTLLYGKEGKRFVYQLLKEVRKLYRIIIDICTKKKIFFVKNSLFIPKKYLFPLSVEARNYSMFLPEQKTGNATQKTSVKPIEDPLAIQRMIASLAFAYGWTEKDILNMRYEIVFDYVKLIDSERAKQVLDDTNSALFGNPYAAKVTKDVIKNLNKRAYVQVVRKKTPLDLFKDLGGRMN